MSLNDMSLVSPTGPLKICGSYIGENTPEVFKKSRIFLRKGQPPSPLRQAQDRDDEDSIKPEGRVQRADVRN
jgi:hypothetical protein